MIKVLSTLVEKYRMGDGRNDLKRTKKSKDNEINIYIKDQSKLKEEHESLKQLANKFKWPEIPNTIKNYHFSLDGGGRSLIKEEIYRSNAKIILEIGVFLGGSALEWLSISEDLVVVGIDPWEAKFSKIIERYSLDPLFKPCFENIRDIPEFIESLRTNGSFISALANLRKFKNRFIPVQGYSPSVLYQIKQTGLRPDLIYIDSNKVMDDLLVCYTLFPNAILCGDDWTWGREKGYPVKAAVESFSLEHGFRVRNQRATWIIEKYER